MPLEKCHVETNIMTIFINVMDMGISQCPDLSLKILWKFGICLRNFFRGRMETKTPKFFFPKITNLSYKDTIICRQNLSLLRFKTYKIPILKYKKNFPIPKTNIRVPSNV